MTDNSRCLLSKRCSRMLVFRSTLLFIGAIAAVLAAQTVRFVPDTAAATHLWRVGSATELYIGASFYYMNPQDSIVVWCDTSESDLTGELYVMVPGYADSAIYLFTNRQKGSRINVSRLLGTTIPVRTEFFFMYRFTTANSGGTPVSLTRFTGQNRPGIDPQDQVRYPGARFVTRDFGYRPGFGHRWAVAGRIRDNNGTPNDTLVFGFEDGNLVLDPAYDSVMVADFDFNDVIFRVTGLQLNVELIPDSLLLSVSQSPARAGDTVRCTAGVWADSSGISLRTPQFDSLIRWQLTGAGINRDTLIELPNNDSTTLFVGKSSGATCVLHAWFIAPLTGDTVTVSRTLPVIAGTPASLSIELRADTSASGFSRNRAAPAADLQIASNQTSRSAYALWRDRYGNFTGYSLQTIWDTLTSGQQGLTPGIAAAENGDKSLGEGVIRKTGGSGYILVTARDTTGGATHADTLRVGVVGANYDTLRLLARTASDSIPVASLRLSTDQCTTLIAQGRRTDNGSWETIEAQWDFPYPWNSADASTARSHLSFCPEDTGSGTLVVIHTAFVKLNVQIQAVAGVPARLVLYQNNAPLPADTTARAGRTFTCSAHLFDKHGVWRSEFSLLSDATPLTWKILESTVLADTLDSTGSFVNMRDFDAGYLPLKAHRTVRLVALWNGLSDTCRLSVLPGVPYRVVIEPDADWKKSPNSAHPIDTVEIPDTRTSASIYAIVRDSLGNYVDSLRTGGWESTDTIVTVTYGTPVCKGTVIKNISVTNGVTRVIVTSSEGGFADSAWVRLLPYHYINLRITAENGKSIDSLFCTTNDDTVIIAEALRSDTALWREVGVIWEASSSITLAPVPPRGASRYVFTPQQAAQGWISAELTADNLSDTLFVRFERGRPLWASLQLLTPEPERIAGDTLLAVVKIYNRPGLVEGEYCFPRSAADSVMYIDSLGGGGRSNAPQAIIDNRAVPVITPENTRGAGRQCFHNGIDTVRFLLYYAPAAADSLHRLRFLAGDLNAATAPFRLLPGPLASMRISHPKMSTSPDTLFLQSPDETAILTATGYDRYGNSRGELTSRWSISGTLHALENTGPLSRIKYSTETVTDDESGAVKAKAVVDSTISGMLQIRIRGPLATALTAVTRDMNGNGVLDRIDMTFSLPVAILDAAAVTGNLSVTCNGKNLPVDRVTKGQINTEIRIVLKEPSAPTEPQTGWAPLVTLSNRSFQLDDAVDSVSITCVDGAGPVIWSVTKEMTTPDNRAQDRVTVVFSENVYGNDGRKLPLSRSPDKLFDAWIQNGKTGYTELPLLDGIDNLFAVTSYDSLVFIMRNGNDLTNQHFLSIHVDTAGTAQPQIADNTGSNRPPSNNHKVRVTVTGTPTGDLLIAPNPMRPTARRQPPKTFRIQHNASAIDWVLQDGAGVVLQFKIALPDEKNVRLDGKIIIYDFVGNRVAADPVAHLNPMGVFRADEDFIMNSAPRKNIIPSSWTPNGSVYDYSIYWNGYTLGGMPAAPGIYRAVLTVVITSSKGKETRTFINTVGVRR